MTAVQFDVEQARREFPILGRLVNGRPLIWLDNAATTQKPQAVIDRLKTFYECENSNVHRSGHVLASRATEAYEAAREKVRAFINASSVNEISFVRGATEAINLVAQSWGRQNISAGDEILITWLEHHANIVPWQQLAYEKGARLRVAPVDETGQIIFSEFEELLSRKTRLVAVTHASNALGTITPLKQMIDAAHIVGAKVLIDGAQAVSHMPVNVRGLDADWYVFSGHKIYGPTGIGVLYGREALLNETPPWQMGGNMIRDVTFERTIFNPAPNRFEAGTANIADAVALGAALSYVTDIGLDQISDHEKQLMRYATRRLSEIPGVSIIGTAAQKGSVLSFVMKGRLPKEAAETLSRAGIAVRAGHHCAQPILRRFGLESTVRLSFGLYNTFEEIDAVAEVLV